ncbi:hypothetical protein [Cupriavidus sp. TMH.W2]|uniref:hypothetical protein n=1 Tax=Cupriavidus sp. TMH.W2 TaxID=3434465 RepID=UPI003D76ADFF
MSNTQRAIASPTRTRQAARLLPVLSELRQEVRSLSRRAHRLALAQADGDDDACRHQLAQLFERWIEDASPRKQVVCFASAAEFGLPLHRQAERCRAAAMRDGSDAVRALYWAALHRTRCRLGSTAQMEDAQGAAAQPAAATADQGQVPPAATARPLCRRCERLRLDARCANGHGALRPLGDMQWRSLAAGVQCQTREHQCDTCHTRWTQHRSAADPFMAWTISRRDVAMPARDVLTA